MGDILSVTILWALFFFSHSFFADDAVKRFFISKVFKQSKVYRLFYSLFSSGYVLFLIGWIALAPGDTMLFGKTIVNTSTGLFFIILSLLLARAAFRPFSITGFIGIAEEKQELYIAGLHEKIRHPLYLSVICLYLGIILLYPSKLALISAICMIIYLPVGIYLEEKKLIKKFGESYVKYRRATPAIFSIQLFFK